MSTPVDVDLANVAAERAKVELMSYFRELVPRNLGSTGETYNTKDMPRADRILAFLERRESGALEILRGIAPKWYDQLFKDFEEDVAQSPMFGTTQKDERIRKSAKTTIFDDTGVV